MKSFREWTQTQPSEEHPKWPTCAMIDNYLKYAFGCQEFSFGPATVHIPMKGTGPLSVYANDAEAAKESGYRVGFGKGQRQGYDSGYAEGLAGSEAYKTGYMAGRRNALPPQWGHMDTQEMDRLRQVEKAAIKCGNTYCESMKEAFGAITDLRDSIGIDQAEVWAKGKGSS